MSDLGESISIPEPPEEVKEDEKSVKIRFSVFFDGTLNNRTNIDQRLVSSSDEDLTEEEQAIADELKGKMSPEEIEEAKEIYEKHQGVGSYENGYTNIVTLEKYVDTSAQPPYDIALATYVEGPGTIDKKGDRFAGYALGVWKSGVEKKVKKGLLDVTNKIRSNNSRKDVVIELITLDVFGFSRGAAAARNFIHEALLEAGSIANQLKEKGYKISKTEVCLAGLYDTVSSHGISFNDDTGKLKLDAVSHAQDVVQLAAADEHRANFSLTNIKSANGKGREIYLPGVHSDVGGSYRDGASEDQKIFWKMGSNSEEIVNQHRQELIDAGWYKEDELTIKSYFRTRGRGARVKVAVLHARRDSISNQYSRITLHVMADFARENKIEIKDVIQRKEKVPAELSSVQNSIKAYVDEHKAKGANTSRPNHWHDKDKPSWLPKLRHDYFHFSARLGIGNGPRFENGKRQRKVING